MSYLRDRHLTARTLMAALALVTAASAQEKQQDPSTIRVETDLVSVEVTVTDRDGAPVTALLRAEDFVVHEDGARQKITNFAATDVPFNLVLVLDTSGSTRGDVDLMRRAAAGFLAELRPRDRVAVVGFNEQVQLYSRLTSDREAIERALGRIQPGSGTSFYDALHLTLREVLRKVEGRKAIVTLTDGVDSTGTYTFDLLRLELEKAGTTCYFLELNTEAFTRDGMLLDCEDDRHFKFSRKQAQKYYGLSGKGFEWLRDFDHCRLSAEERKEINGRLYEAGRGELRELARQTGGRVYPVEDLGRLAPAYAQIAAELRTQYSLGYYSTNDRRDGKWRELRVEVKRPGLVAHAKPGYRAPRY